MRAALDEASVPPCPPWGGCTARRSACEERGVTRKEKRDETTRMVQTMAER
jgi:hypothetical protein